MPVHICIHRHSLDGWRFCKFCVCLFQPVMSQQSSQTSNCSLEPMMSQETFDHVFSNITGIFDSQQDFHRYELKRVAKSGS